MGLLGDAKLEFKIPLSLVVIIAMAGSVPILIWAPDGYQNYALYSGGLLTLLTGKRTIVERTQAKNGSN